MDTEILKFDHLEAEKIEFEVGRSDFEKWQFSNFFFAKYFNVETPCTFQILFPLIRRYCGNKKYFFLKYFMPTISSDKRKKDLKCTGWINIKISGKKIAIFQNLT